MASLERGALKEWKNEAIGNYCSDSSRGTRHPRRARKLPRPSDTLAAHFQRPFP